MEGTDTYAADSFPPRKRMKLGPRLETDSSSPRNVLRSLHVKCCNPLKDMIRSALRSPPQEIGGCLPMGSLAVEQLSALRGVCRILMKGGNTDMRATAEAMRVDSMISKTEQFNSIRQTAALSKESKGGGGRAKRHVCFYDGPACRQLIANELLQFSEQPGIKTHFQWAMRVFMAYVMVEKSTKFRSAAKCLVCLLDIMLAMVPAVWEFGAYLDIATEFSQLLSVSSLPILVEFLGSKQVKIFQEFNRTQVLSGGDKKKIQVIGAKLVGIITSVEKRLRHTQEVQHIFTLRRVLVESLPLTHAGVCNKTHKSADVVEAPLESSAVWQELAQWEGPSEVEGDTANKGQDATTSSDSGCPYSVYEAYTKLQKFLQSPETAVLQSDEEVKKMQAASISILSYFKKNKPSTSAFESFAGKTPLADISSSAAFREAVDESFFRKEFLYRMCLAFQTLNLPTKKDITVGSQPPKFVSAMGKLDEKRRRIFFELRTQVWKQLQDFKGFEVEVRYLLAKEHLWIQWKQVGCNESVMQPLQPKAPPQLEVLNQLKEEARLAAPPLKRNRSVCSFINFLSAWDKAIRSEKGSDGASPLRLACPETPDLLRQAKEWYVHLQSVPPPKYPEVMLTTKLIHKLNDYRQKVLSDDNPENEVDEKEKGKYDPLFRWRLSRLFAVQYLDAYMDMSNNDTISGKVDSLIRAMDQFDSAAEKHSAATSSGQKSEVKNGSTCEEEMRSEDEVKGEGNLPSSDEGPADTQKEGGEAADEERGGGDSDDEARGCPPVCSAVNDDVDMQNES